MDRSVFDQQVCAALDPVMTAAGFAAGQGGANAVVCDPQPFRCDPSTDGRPNRANGSMTTGAWQVVDLTPVPPWCAGP